MYYSSISLDVHRVSFWVGITNAFLTIATAAREKREAFHIDVKEGFF